MAIDLPVVGQQNWGEPLNASLRDMDVTRPGSLAEAELSSRLSAAAGSAEGLVQAERAARETALALKADKTDVYTKAETYSRAETGTQITNAVTASRPPLYGTGFPNGKVAAPVGALYSDEAVTNGASLWQKIAGTGNTGWKVVSGDTGVRNISSLANPVWDLAIPAGGLFISRVGPEVTLRLYGQLPVATTRPSVVTLPVGFRAVFGETGAAIEQTGVVGIPMAIFSRTASEVAVGPGLVPAGQRISAVLKFTTIDSDWPSTLPGTN